MLKLKNPHSVLAVLRFRAKDVDRILIPKSQRKGAWEEVWAQAKKESIRIVEDTRESRGPRRSSQGRESFAEAWIQPKKSLGLNEVFGSVSESKEGLWLALDCIQDPQNVGAIFRTAAFFGIQGVLMTQDRSAPMSATVYDVAAGGVESVPFCQVANLQRALEQAKEKDVWVLGSSEHKGDEISRIPVDRNWLLVLGNEERGIRPLTEKNCDQFCRIPARGSVTSLNVSSAAGGDDFPAL